MYVLLDLDLLNQAPLLRFSEVVSSVLPFPTGAVTCQLVLGFRLPFCGAVNPFKTPGTIKSASCPKCNGAERRTSELFVARCQSL